MSKPRERSRSRARSAVSGLSVGSRRGQGSVSRLTMLEESQLSQSHDMRSQLRSPMSHSRRSEPAGEDQLFVVSDGPPARGTFLAGMAGVMNIDLVTTQKKDRGRSHKSETDEEAEKVLKKQQDLCEKGCCVVMYRSISGEAAKKVWLQLEEDRLTFRSLTRKQEVLAFQRSERERKEKIDKKNERMAEKKKLAEQQGRKEKLLYTEQKFVPKTITDRVKDCTLFIVDVEDGDDGVERYKKDDPDDRQKFERDPSWSAAIMEEGALLPENCLRIRYRDFTIGKDSELCVSFDNSAPDRHPCHPSYGLEKRKKGKGELDFKGRGPWSAAQQRDAWWITLKRKQFGFQGNAPSAIESFEMAPLRTMIEKTWVFADEDGGGNVSTKTEVEEVLSFCNIQMKRKRLVQQIADVLTSKWAQMIEEGEEYKGQDVETVKCKVEEGVDLSKVIFERLLWKCRDSTEIIDGLWKQYSRDMPRMPLMSDKMDTRGFDKFLEAQDRPAELRARKRREEKKIREKFEDESAVLIDKAALEVAEREMRKDLRRLDAQWRQRKLEREARNDLVANMVKSHILVKHKEKLSKGKFTTFLIHSSLNSATSPWCLKDFVGNAKRPSEWEWPPLDGPFGKREEKNADREFADLGECPWDRPLRDFYIATSVNTAYGCIVNPIVAKEPREKAEAAIAAAALKEKEKKEKEKELAAAKARGESEEVSSKAASTVGHGKKKGVPVWEHESYLPRAGPLPVGATKFLTGREAVERVMTEFNPRAIHIAVGAMPLEKEELKFFQKSPPGESPLMALQRMMQETDIWPFRRRGVEGSGAHEKKLKNGLWKLVVGHRDLDSPLDHWSRADGRNARKGNYPQDFSEMKHNASQQLYDGRKSARAYRRGVPFRQILEVVRENAFPDFCKTPLILILEVPESKSVLDHVATEIWDVLGPRADDDGEQVDPSTVKGDGTGGSHYLRRKADGEDEYIHTEGPLGDLKPDNIYPPSLRGVAPNEDTEPQGTVLTPEDKLMISDPWNPTVKELGGVGNLPLRLLRGRIIIGIKLVRNSFGWKEGKPEWSGETLATLSRGLHRITGLEFIQGNARGPSAPPPKETREAREARLAREDTLSSRGMPQVAEWSVHGAGFPLASKRYEDISNGKGGQESVEVTKASDWRAKWAKGDPSYPLPYPMAINWPRCGDSGIFQDQKKAGRLKGANKADRSAMDDAASTASGRTAFSTRSGVGGRRAPGSKKQINLLDEEHYGELQWRRNEAQRMLVFRDKQEFDAGVRSNTDYCVCWTEQEVKEKLNEVRQWQKRMEKDEIRKMKEDLRKKKEDTGYMELLPPDEDLPKASDFVNSLHSWTREHLCFVTADRESSEKDVLEMRDEKKKSEDYEKHKKRTQIQFDKESYHPQHEFKGQRNKAYTNWSVLFPPDDESLNGCHPGVMESWSAGCQFVGIEHLPDPNTIDGQIGVSLRSTYRSKFRMSHGGCTGFVLKPTHLLSVPDPKMPPRVGTHPNIKEAMSTENLHRFVDEGAPGALHIRRLLEPYHRTPSLAAVRDLFDDAWIAGNNISKDERRLSMGLGLTPPQRGNRRGSNVSAVTRGTDAGSRSRV
eukprot:Hpha_TRINITY_DN16685_c2_g1::TRINITY_DN16685_c2_g1_i1::g.178960::m.178960